MESLLSFSGIKNTELAAQKINFKCKIEKNIQSFWSLYKEGK
jgi:hypothetical protein